MRTVLIAVAVLILSACGDPTPMPKYDIDQCMRREIFQQCLQALPKGPEHVSNSNDWAEVVEACESAAHDQSFRIAGHVKPECKI